MSKKKFTHTTIEDLIHDHEFFERIKELKTEDQWRSFLEENHESKEKILKAKKFIELFVVKEEELRADKKHALWVKIKNINKNTTRKYRAKKLRQTIGIAASVLIVISLSSIVYFSSKKQSKNYVFAETVKITNESNPILTLANGDQIEVQKDESQIAVLETDNSVKINNDTILSATSFTKAERKKDIQLNELIIPFGKKSMVILNDGTKVWLNAGSKFAFPQKFTGKSRRVFLDGEGYFEVAENKKQPFIVSSDNVNVEVLGTKFNVSTYSFDELSETVLLEGRVNVWSNKKWKKSKITMYPNQKATYSEKEDEIIVETESEALDYIAWIDGWYKFSNENLEQIFNKIGRFYNVTFQYDRQAIERALPVSGKLDLKESIEEVMSTLSKVANISYRVEGKKIIIN